MQTFLTKFYDLKILNSNLFHIYFEFQTFHLVENIIILK